MVWFGIPQKRARSNYRRAPLQGSSLDLPSLLGDLPRLKGPDGSADFSAFPHCPKDLTIKGQPFGAFTKYERKGKPTGRPGTFEFPNQNLALTWSTQFGLRRISAAIGWDRRLPSSLLLIVAHHLGPPDLGA